MKLRSLLLTAALFLSTAAAFAEIVSVDPGPGWYWQMPDGETSLTVTLTKNKGANWHYGLYSLNSAWETELDNGENEISLDEGVTQVGVWAYQGNGGGAPEKKDAYSAGAISNGAGFHFSNTGTVISFGKESDKASVDFGENGGGTFGAPLPTPVATLLIALGFGAALVMYRNRKQARA